MLFVIVVAMGIASILIIPKISQWREKNEISSIIEAEVLRQYKKEGNIIFNIRYKSVRIIMTEGLDIEGNTITVRRGVFRHNGYLPARTFKLGFSMDLQRYNTGWGVAKFKDLYCREYNGDPETDKIIEEYRLDYEKHPEKYKQEYEDHLAEAKQFLDRYIELQVAEGWPKNECTIGRILNSVAEDNGYTDWNEVTLRYKRQFGYREWKRMVDANTDKLYRIFGRNPDK